jgi:STE24 endopeptidase
VILLKYFFLGWIILKEVVVIVLEVINLHFSKNKNKVIPSSLQSIITKDRFKRSLEYLKDRTLFGINRTVFNLLFTLLLLILVAPWLERLVIHQSTSIIWQGLLYFGLIFLINFMISIPFSLFEDFRIEAKYGFNKTTYKLFFKDSLKSFIITILLGGLFLSGILYILIKNTFWWFPLSIASSLFMVVAIWVFPVFLMPLFNKFKPLDEGDLKETIIDFTSKNKININKIFVMDASTRSTHGNAFLTGIGFSRRLVLFDTILTYPKEEILSIIAHEWGHQKHNDIYRQLVSSILSFVVILFLSNLLFISGTINSAFGVVTPYSLLFYSFTLISPILFFLSPITNYLIRKQEYEADLFSLLMTKDLNSAVISLKRLIRDNLSNLNPHPLYRVFYYTHPAPEERIQHLVDQARLNKIS